MTRRNPFARAEAIHGLSELAQALRGAPEPAVPETLIGKIRGNLDDARLEVEFQKEAVRYLESIVEAYDANDAKLMIQRIDAYAKLDREVWAEEYRARLVATD